MGLDNNMSWQFRYAVMLVGVVYDNLEIDICGYRYTGVLWSH